jgi:hypothetical protein
MNTEANAQTLSAPIAAPRASGPASSSKGLRKAMAGAATVVAALVVLASVATGGAAAASRDYASPDGVCYTNGWCHWSEVCYDAFGGCYFDFWCPQGATSTGQCTYSGGFAAYTTATSSASGPGSSDTITGSATVGDGSNGGTNSGGSSLDVTASSGETLTISGDCDGILASSSCLSPGDENYSQQAETSVTNGAGWMEDWRSIVDGYAIWDSGL